MIALPPWRAHVAAALYLTGADWHHVSLLMGGISRQRVFRLLDRAGVTYRHRTPLTDAQMDAALQAARRAGLTERAAILAHAAAALGCAPTYYALGPRLTALAGGPRIHIPSIGQEQTHGWCVVGRHFHPLDELVSNGASLTCRPCRNARMRAYTATQRRAEGRPTRDQAFRAKSARAEARARAHFAAADASGLSDAAYADQAGISYSTLRSWRMRYGAPKRRTTEVN